MTEPRHFHSARKGSGSLRPFPIYPLYTQTVILSLDKPIADCFLFRPRKSRKSAGNAVIPTFPTHWSHGLQHLRHKRRNARFKGLRRVHTPPHLLTSHTAAYTAKQGAFWMGALSLPSEHFARFGNPVWPGVRTAYFAAFGSWSGVFPKNAESLRDSDALMRVAVSQRRGPAGLRDPVAVSLTAPMGFAVLSGHDNSMQRKILVGFTRWFVPCVLPPADVPVPAPQHPTAADKTGRWKTGSAGSCRADFRFACARPA